MSKEEKEKKILSLLTELIELTKDKTPVKKKQEVKPVDLETSYPHFTMYLNPPCDFSVIVCGRTADLPLIGMEDPCKDYED